MEHRNRHRTGTVTDVWHAFVALVAAVITPVVFTRTLEAWGNRASCSLENVKSGTTVATSANEPATERDPSWDQYQAVTDHTAGHKTLLGEKVYARG